MQLGISVSRNKNLPREAGSAYRDVAENTVPVRSRPRRCPPSSRR